MSYDVIFRDTSTSPALVIDLTQFSPYVYNVCYSVK